VLPNVGIGELMLVLVIGLLVVGPQRLPEITRAAAKAWRTFQQETNKAKAAIQEVLEEPTRELKEAFAEPQAEIRNQIEEARKLKGVFDQPDQAASASKDPHARPPAPSSPSSHTADPVIPDTPVIRDYEDT
jgi:sec-independent protein translocase protein TatB